MKKKNSTGGKRGVIGGKEVELIKQYLGQGMPILEIAKRLHRHPDTIQRKIDNLNLIHLAMPNAEQEFRHIRDKLHSKRYWSELKKQFTKEELEYFEVLWIDLILQFREDVLPSEELQIKQLVTIEILLNRSMKERKAHVEEVDRLQRQVDRLYAQPDDVRDAALLASLETQLSYARNSITSYTNEYTKLLGEQKSIQKDLKSTRDQRIKRIEDSKSSFAGWLKALEDEERRERTGRNVALMRLAKDRAKEELSEWHVYQDGIADQPLLTPDTVKDE